MSAVITPEVLPVTVEYTALKCAQVWKSQGSACFRLLYLRKGDGVLKRSVNLEPFKAPCLLALSPYQNGQLDLQQSVEGWMIRFHANFFCIETHHHAIGCNGVLFHNIYESPLVALASDDLLYAEQLSLELEAENQGDAIASEEALRCYLKLLLIQGTRLKMSQNAGELSHNHVLLRRFRELLEQYHCTEHRPSAYANLLGVSYSQLAQVAKQYLGESLSGLIRQRVLMHAKWLLLHSRTSIKEIAFKVGYQDEFYFSRLFRKTYGVSPMAFRQYETQVRGGSNLSM